MLEASRSPGSSDFYADSPPRHTPSVEKKRKRDSQSPQPREKKIILSPPTSTLPPKPAIVVPPTESHSSGSLGQAPSEPEIDQENDPANIYLNQLADSFIYDKIPTVANLSASDCSRISVGILIHVRDRMRQERPEINLTLHHMKWTYFNKVMPLIEPIRKDVFLCAVCQTKGKYYAFDGVILHYASKHTKDFTFGNATVSWSKAKWPENPPFTSSPQIPTNTPAVKTQSRPGTTNTAHAFSPPAYFEHPLPAPMPRPSLPKSMQAINQPQYNQYQFPAEFPYVAASAALNSPYGPPPNLQSWNPYAGSPPGQVAYPSPAFAFPSPLPSAYSTATSPLDDNNLYRPPGPYTPAPIPGTWNRPASQPVFPPSPNLFRTPSIPQNVSNFHQAQLTELAKIALEIWTNLVPVKPIPPSVRMYVIIFHVISKFPFSNVPSLDLFCESLLSNPLLGAMKDANGLACKTCVVMNEGHDKPQSQHFHQTAGQRKLYSFYSLLLHFKHVHVQKVQGSSPSTQTPTEDSSRLDWKQDMIELPDDPVIVELANARGMDQGKLETIAKAFPTLFSGAIHAGLNKSQVAYHNGPITHGRDSGSRFNQGQPPRYVVLDDRSRRSRVSMNMSRSTQRAPMPYSAANAIPYVVMAPDVIDQYDPSDPAPLLHRSSGQFLSRDMPLGSVSHSK